MLLLERFLLLSQECPRYLKLTRNQAIPLLVTHLLDIPLLKDTLPLAILSLVSLLPQVFTHLSIHPNSHSTHLNSHSTHLNSLSIHLNSLLILDSIHLLVILSSLPVSLPVATKLPQATPDLVVLPLNTQVVTLLSQVSLNLATPVTLPSSSPTPDSTHLKATLPVGNTTNDELLNYYLVHPNT